jgi:hypothetical protein
MVAKWPAWIKARVELRRMERRALDSTRRNKGCRKVEGVPADHSSTPQFYLGLQTQV